MKTGLLGNAHKTCANHLKHYRYLIIEWEVGLKKSPNNLDSKCVQSSCAQIRTKRALLLSYFWKLLFLPTRSKRYSKRQVSGPFTFDRYKNNQSKPNFSLKPKVIFEKEKREMSKKIGWTVKNPLDLNLNG